MKFLKWLKDRGGKVALSALQTAGLATVVGVTGIGVYNFLGSSSDDTAASSSSYNPGEVVYVAGAPAQGGTAGITGLSGATGTTNTDAGNESSVRITARTLARLEQQEERERISREMEEYGNANYSPDNSSGGAGSQGGITEGLGMNANLANAMGNGGMGDDPMGAMSGMMNNMQGMISQANQQVQGVTNPQTRSGKPEDGAGKSEGTPSLKQLSLPSAGGNGGSGSNAFNSTFTIQDSGKNRKKGAELSSSDADVLAAAQKQINSINEQMKLQSAPPTGKSGGMGNNNESTVSAASRFGYKVQHDNKGMKDIRWIAARSNKAALTNTRSANEGVRAFMSDEKVSGGMSFVRDHYETGGGQGSKDYDTSVNTSLKGLGSWGTDIVDESDRREDDRNNMKKWFWIALGVASASSILIPILKPITIMGIPVGYWLALALAAISTAFCALGFIKALTYAQTWGKSGFSTMSMVVTGLLTASVWVSFFLSHGASKPSQTMAQNLLGPQAQPPGGVMMG